MTSLPCPLTNSFVILRIKFVPMTSRFCSTYNFHANYKPRSCKWYNTGYNFVFNSLNFKLPELCFCNFHLKCIFRQKILKLFLKMYVYYRSNIDLKDWIVKSALLNTFYLLSLVKKLEVCPMGDKTMSLNYFNRLNLVLYIQKFTVLQLLVITLFKRFDDINMNK